MWVVQEFPDSWRVMRTHENGAPVAEPVEVKRFALNEQGRAAANVYLAGLIDHKAQIDEVLAG